MAITSETIGVSKVEFGQPLETGEVVIVDSNSLALPGNPNELEQLKLGLDAPYVFKPHFIPIAEIPESAYHHTSQINIYTIARRRHLRNLNTIGRNRF